MYDRKIEQINERWAKKTDFTHTFFGYPPLRDNNRMRITGQTEEWEYIYFLRTLLSDRLPVAKALSIFCGHGENEIRLAQAGAFQYCLALDISVKALEQARNAASQVGIDIIEFKCQDLNQPDVLPINEFDLVIANGALHHSMDLKSLMTQLKKSMKSNALFLSIEYIGADHYGRTYRQEQLIAAMQTLIPRSLTYGSTGSNSWRGYLKHIMRLTASNSRLAFQLLDSVRKQRLVRKDPSEGVHASQIVAYVQETFSEAEIRYFGGSLLPYVITPALMDTLDLSDPVHYKLVENFIHMEEVAEALGEVPHSNAALIAWNR